MPTVTFIGNASNTASIEWKNTITAESFTFPLNVPVNIDPDAPENAGRRELARHIIDKLIAIKHPHYKLDTGDTKIFNGVPRGQYHKLDSVPSSTEIYNHVLPVGPTSDNKKIDGRTKKGRALKARKKETQGRIDGTDDPNP